MVRGGGPSLLHKVWEGCHENKNLEDKKIINHIPSYVAFTNAVCAYFQLHTHGRNYPGF